jgi:glycerophosphoryl diester phosphodiesterase
MLETKTMIIAILFLLLTAAFLLYMIKPNSRRFTGFPIQMFAHRGLHRKGIPENSSAAFIRAVERGFGVELDVRFTSDKKLIVFHDDNLKRMCGADIPVKSVSYDQLKEYRLAGTNEKIPLFEEVLLDLKGLPVICEIKSLPGEDVQEICEEVCRHLKSYNGFYCIESFNPFVVRWLAKNKPEIIRGQLSMNFMKARGGYPFLQAFFMTHLLVNILGRPDFIAYRFTDDSAGFYLCRKIFKPVCAAWTARGESEQKQARLKYQAIIFEEDRKETGAGHE